MTGGAIMGLVVLVLVVAVAYFGMRGDRGRALTELEASERLYTQAGRTVGR